MRIFESDGLKVKVRTTPDKNGEPLFMAKDVALSMDYMDAKRAVLTHVSDGYKVRQGEIGAVTKGGDSYPFAQIHPNTIFVREPGLYELIFSSHLPIATRFRKWVFEEVLPSIRKIGKYEVTDPIQKVRSIDERGLEDYGKGEKKEYRGIILPHYDIVKDKKAVMRSSCGGRVTQQKIRDLKDRGEKLKNIVIRQNKVISRQNVLISELLEDEARFLWF